MSVRAVVFVYTNHRGERAERHVTPVSIWFGSTEWHPQPQWLLKGYDHDRMGARDFALKDVEGWRPSDAEPEPVATRPVLNHTGDVCRTCGGMLVQTGTCKTCMSCGTPDGGCG